MSFQADEARDRNRVSVGTWKMLSTVRQLDGSDEVINNFGEQPKGIMIITPDYRFIQSNTWRGPTIWGMSMC